MNNIQILFFFISGFFISRLLIKVRFPQRFIYYLLEEKVTSVTRILFYLIASSALLSFFIPNVITVLTMLPVLELLRKTLDQAVDQKGSIPTMLALCVIYGANIGGMGSVTATPANAILITYLELHNVAGAEQLSFASWLVWGVPLVIGLVMVAWMVLAGMFRPWKMIKQGIHINSGSEQTYHPMQGMAIGITVTYFVSSLVLSILIVKLPEHDALILGMTVFITLLFVIFLFGVKFPGDAEHASKKPLLILADCYNDLPVKGFIFVGVVFLLAGVVYAFDVQQYFIRWVEYIIPDGLPIWALFIILALITSYTTEILSNTVVQISLFTIMLPLATIQGFSALQALILITLSCTCAFMSPIATGVSGLAYGGVQGVSLRRMLFVGSIMNVLGALIISFYVASVISWVYSGA